MWRQKAVRLLFEKGAIFDNFTFRTKTSTNLYKTLTLPQAQNVQRPQQHVTPPDCKISKIKCVTCYQSKCKSSSIYTSPKVRSETKIAMASDSKHQITFCNYRSNVLTKRLHWATKFLATTTGCYGMLLTKSGSHAHVTAKEGTQRRKYTLVVNAHFKDHHCKGDYLWVCGGWEKTSSKGTSTVINCRPGDVNCLHWTSTVCAHKTETM